MKTKTVCIICDCLYLDGAICEHCGIEWEINEVQEDIQQQTKFKSDMERRKECDPEHLHETIDLIIQDTEEILNKLYLKQDQIREKYL